MCAFILSDRSLLSERTFCLAFAARLANGPSDHDAISSLFDDFFQMPTPNSSASATPSSGPAPPTPMTILVSAN